MGDLSPFFDRLNNYATPHLGARSLTELGDVIGVPIRENSVWLEEIV